MRKHPLCFLGIVLFNNNPAITDLILVIVDLR